MGFPRSQGFMRHAFSEYRRIILPGELDKKKIGPPSGNCVKLHTKFSAWINFIPKIFLHRREGGRIPSAEKSRRNEVELEAKISFNVICKNISNFVPTHS